MFFARCALAIAVFTSLARCTSRFIVPEEYDEDEDANKDFNNNRRYTHGSTIHLIWETDLDAVDIWLWQRYRTYSLGGPLDRSIRAHWTAEYNVGGGDLANGEDSVYWFEMLEADTQEAVGFSQYVNVSAPESHTIETVTISKTQVLQTQTLSTMDFIMASTTQSITTSPPSRTPVSNAASGNSSGLSQGATTGIAVGVTLCGVLLFGVSGWLAWRRFKRSKQETDVPKELPDRQEQFLGSSGTKAELPSHPTTNASQGIRKVSGLHELA